LRPVAVLPVMIDWPDRADAATARVIRGVVAGAALLAWMASPLVLLISLATVGRLGTTDRVRVDGPSPGVSRLRRGVNTHPVGR
jgi:hypothetical protein